MLKGKGDNQFVKITNQQGPSGFVLFMAWIGAFVYFFQQQPDVGGFFMAILKAIVWPAFLLFHGLDALNV